MIYDLSQFRDVKRWVGWGGRTEGLYILEPVQCSPLKDKDRGL